MTRAKMSGSDLLWPLATLNCTKTTVTDYSLHTTFLQTNTKNSIFQTNEIMACYGINFDRVRQPVHSDDENDMIKCSVLPNTSHVDQDCAIMVKNYFDIDFRVDFDTV